MAQVTIGLKKKAAEGGAQTDKRPDIELTEEDLKQIAGGTTKGIQLRPGAGSSRSHLKTQARPGAHPEPIQAPGSAGVCHRPV